MIARLDFFRTALIGLTAWSWLVCGKPGSRTTDMILDYDILWSTSGGFTGGGEGYTLYRDGRLESWTQVRASLPRETKFIGNVSNGAVLKIRRIVQENELLRFNHNVTGNMTTSLIFRNDDGEHSVSWPANAKAAPQQIASLMEQLHAVIAAFKK